ncbi:F-box only protein 47-like isoform X2 [Centruroides sculpturatus]|uniref:F-box only protein 47-like isoform X2 n=1 Tax=Centruroides sculpturatus TaxID=218467 RepID=UPI000C6ED30A|nr:F-box only protein 47-like isoform X2 [Centruroides sculpturatus]
MKRSTCLYPMKQRIMTSLEFINKFECNRKNKILNRSHFLQCCGSNPEKEMYVRTYYRFIYLDYCWNSTDRNFWLSKILKPWPLKHQAKLLFLLYGFVRSDKIQWFELLENIPEDYSEASRKLAGVPYLHHTANATKYS